METVTSLFAAKNGVGKRVHQPLYAAGSDYTTVGAFSGEGVTPQNTTEKMKEGAEADKGILCASISGWKDVGVTGCL